MPDKLTIQVQSQGWEQILAARKEMLDAFDTARKQARSHEVETYHGKVAEAQFREWLSSFLPTKYGVTSGYIVSSGLKSTDKTPHYDVIIYDRLESPILWIEKNPDSSEHGKSRAIPVEYVKSVLEVKSSFSPETVDKAIQHLADLLPLMMGVDTPNEKYKVYLPETFCCGIIFFDLKREFQFSESAMNKIISGNKCRGFFGGIILRGEGHELPVSARISLYHSETPIESTIGHDKESLLRPLPIGKSIQMGPNLHVGSMLNWTESNFSQFAFDLIAMMQGTYDPRYASSFYGMGRTPNE